MNAASKLLSKKIRIPPLSLIVILALAAVYLVPLVGERRLDVLTKLLDVVPEISVVRRWGFMKRYRFNMKTSLNGIRTNPRPRSGEIWPQRRPRWPELIIWHSCWSFVNANELPTIGKMNLARSALQNDPLNCFEHSSSPRRSPDTSLPSAKTQEQRDLIDPVSVLYDKTKRQMRINDWQITSCLLRNLIGV